MENKELKDFCQNLDKEKKIIEFKVGKKKSENCFHTNIDKKKIIKIFKKLKKYDVKYFNNKVYYYNNLQLIVDSNGSQKCYFDRSNMEKIDIETENMDMRIISKEREKFDDIKFPCKKKYDLVFKRELVSISIKNNLKINIYNKIISDKDNYEISVQYLYNPSKKEDILMIFNLVLSLFNEINEI